MKAEKRLSLQEVRLNKPPIPCCHYDNCKAYVFGPDYDLETIADIRFGAETKLDSNGPSHFAIDSEGLWRLSK